MDIPALRHLIPRRTGPLAELDLVCRHYHCRAGSCTLLTSGECRQHLSDDGHKTGNECGCNEGRAILQAHVPAGISRDDRGIRITTMQDDGNPEAACEALFNDFKVRPPGGGNCMLQAVFQHPPQHPLLDLRLLEWTGFAMIFLMSVAGFLLQHQHHRNRIGRRFIQRLCFRGSRVGKFIGSDVIRHCCQPCHVSFVASSVVVLIIADQRT